MKNSQALVVQQVEEQTTMRINEEEAVEQSTIAHISPSEVPPLPTYTTQEAVNDEQPTKVVVEVVSPPRATVNIDEECSLATQLDEGELMPIEEVVGSFSNESDPEAECDRIWTWRNWRVLKLEVLKAKVNEMDFEEAFALKWFNIEDIYEALNPCFIEKGRLQKMSSSFKDKGRVETEDGGDNEDDGEDANEEQFQKDILQAKMISRLQTNLPQGEPSTKIEERIDEEDGLYEDELVEFEPSPSYTPIVKALDVEDEDEEDSISGLTVGLEAIRGDIKAPTEPSEKLVIEATIVLLERETGKLPKPTTEQLHQPTTEELPVEIGQSPSEQLNEGTEELHRDGDSAELLDEPSEQLALGFVRIPVRRAVNEYTMLSPSSSDSFDNYLNFSSLVHKSQSKKRKRSDFEE